MKYLLFYSFSLLLFIGCKAQKEHFIKQKSDNSLLWEVSGNGLQKPSFLFGTFHLLCKDDIHFSDQLKKAMQSSDEIYMELDMDDPSIMLSGMLYMNMQNDKKLEDLYTPGEYKRLQNYFSDTLKVPLMMLDKAKPYFLVALLYPRMMNYKNEFQSMLEFYKNQNLDSLKNVISKSETGSDKYDDLLLNNRNKNWVKQLDQIMKNESVFVAVGTGHLLGEKGLINLLRQQGYTVQPLENK